ncbi:hypothetical protein [Turicimonas muris]|uniref:hypothetical protein n=1 Tax=Turicimonas muris TaxID=1796652 RepID=UPI002494295A|nr:hypothetical protein [Turicimonas muris]
MKNPKKDLFEILKDKSLKISGLFNAVQLFEVEAEEIKKLTIERGLGKNVDIKEMASRVISAKKLLDEALAFAIESQLEQAPNDCADKSAQ